MSEEILTQRDPQEEKYMGYCHGTGKERYLAQLQTREQPVSTGFPVFDDYLAGGLRRGLYVLGAVTSLGKTTFAVQLMANLAKQGYDCLYISLEMASTDIITRNLSRDIFMNRYDFATKDIIKLDYALSEITIEESMTLTDRQNKYIEDAANNYFDGYGKHIYVMTGEHVQTVAGIDDLVKSHITYTGRKPIVFVDYMQILRPDSEILSDKQTMDRVVIGLKDISRKYSLPLIAISSIGRQAYNIPIDFKAFKESGLIEFHADYVLGLQYQGVGEKNFDYEQAKAKTPREIELKILKARRSKAGETIPLTYYSMVNAYYDSKLIEPFTGKAVRVDNSIPTHSPALIKRLLE